MLSRLSPRAAFGAVFALCVAMLGAASYLQHVMNLEPCPMCILQRYEFIVLGLIALAGAIHGPKGTLGVRIYSVLLVVAGLVGAGTSIRHSYLQRFPDPVGSCGVELEYLVNTFPLAEALPKIFAGSGECSKVQWRMLGLSIPEWALVWFLLFVAVAIWVGFFRKARA